jgi:hypothetical protein
MSCMPASYQNLKKPGNLGDFVIRHQQVPGAVASAGGQQSTWRDEPYTTECIVSGLHLIRQRFGSNRLCCLHTHVYFKRKAISGIASTLLARLKIPNAELPQEKAHLICDFLVYLLFSAAHASMSADKVNA